MKRLEIINLVVGIVVLILLGIAGFYLQNLVSDTDNNAILLDSANICDLSRTSCVAESSDKKVTIDFSRPVKYLEKFDITVKLTGYRGEKPAKVLVDFSMSDMNMGINRFKLTEQNSFDMWKGFAVLPVCISGRNDWVVRVYVETDRASYLANYKLMMEP